MRYEALGDFNKMISSYRSLIQGAARLKPNQGEVYGTLMQMDFITLFRHMINSTAIIIAQDFDLIDVEDEAEFKQIFGQLDFVNKIVKDNGITYKDAVKQIRNCFSHGNYWIETDDSLAMNVENTPIVTMPAIAFNIHFDNTRKVESDDVVFIKGDMNITDLFPLEQAYTEFARLHSKLKPTWILSSDPKFFKISNRSILEGHLRTLKKTKIAGTEDDSALSKDELALYISKKHKVPLFQLQEQIKGYNAPFYNVEDVPVSDKEKEFLRNYIEYIGYGNYAKLFDNGLTAQYIKQFVDENVISSTFDKIIPEGLLSGFFALAVRAPADNAYLRQQDSFNTTRDMIACSYQGPTLYSSLILALCYYEIVFAKEVNSREKERTSEIFNFKNMQGMEAFVPEIDDPNEPSIRHVDKEEAHNNRVKEYTTELESKRKRVEKLAEKIAKVTRPEFNVGNLAKKAECERRITELEELIKRENEEFSGLRKDEIKYDDYTNFFRYIRNSIIHKNYTVEYNDALKSGKLEKIKFEFTDYRIDDTQKQHPHFRIKLSAKQLLKLLGVLEQNINEQVKENADERLTYNGMLQELSKKVSSGEYQTCTADSFFRSNEMLIPAFASKIKNNKTREER